MKKLDRYIQKLRIEKVVPHIPDGSKVLDVGCYEGELFEALVAKIEYGVGIDPLLEKPVFKEKFKLIPAEFPGGLPLSEKYDVITMLAVLEHFSDSLLKTISSTCYRLLNTKGLLIMTVPSGYVDHILVVLKSMKLIDGMSLEQHNHFDVSGIDSLFGEPEFQALHRERFQFGLNNLFVFQRKD